jgi:hypothetical protein
MRTQATPEFQRRTMLKVSRRLLPLIVVAGVRLTVFERVRPTLEDVFLRLVGGSGTSGTAA